MTEFGSGPTLQQACPWLQEAGARHQRILEVTERDSVIEGLPPFRAETRARILKRLQEFSESASPAAPAG